LAAGANEYISKPIKLKQLVHLIQDLLWRSPSIPLKKGEEENEWMNSPPFTSYRVHTSLTVYVLVYLSPLNPPILGDFERIFFSCSPRIGG
jgi:hypothetical protein